MALQCDPAFLAAKSNKGYIIIIIIIKDLSHVRLLCSTKGASPLDADADDDLYHTAVQRNT